MTTLLHLLKFVAIDILKYMRYVLKEMTFSDIRFPYIPATTQKRDLQ